MEAAAEPGGHPRKRCSSLEILPPTMSELRVVLLGSSWSQRSSVENFILKLSVFNTEPFSCTRNTSRFRNKLVTVINTPDLLSPTEDKLKEFLKDCATLSDPGPHVFLLVLKPEDFNEEHKETLCRILETYNHQSFDRCLILVTPREKSSGLMETHMENPTLKEMIRKCRYRHLKMSDIHRSELLTRLGQVAKENNGEHLTYGVFEETTSPGYPRFLHSSPSGQRLSPKLSSSSADSNREFFDMDQREVKPGDLIIIFCDGYNHWGVYVGGGNVVHFVPAGEGSISISVGGKVLKEKLQDVVKKDRWKINNLLDHKYKPRPADDIVKEACSLVDTEKQFNLLTYNTEHFATEMRYGKPGSRQDQKEFKPGDLIEIFRRGYQHWAVYVGDGNVVHLVGPREGLISIGVGGKVLREKLQDVVKKDRWRVNNLLDHEYPPRPADVIVKEACSQEDTNQQFNLLTYNSEHFATEMRYGKPESLQDQKEVKPGDLIEISHDLYKHWGVYVGDGNVVHLVEPGEGLISIGVVGKVLKEKLKDVVEKDDWTVNNLLDHEYKPRPADDIVEEACSLVDTKKQFNLVTYNSEHFATEMRYGKPESRQVKDAATGVVAGVAGAAAAAALWIAGWVLKRR